tara:strand:- start:939 stop:1514 length:576 start_codon:yes stop_codon:yes gene_type:complete
MTLKTKKKSQVEKEIKGFKKLKKKFKRKEKLRLLGNRGRLSLGWIRRKISKFLEKIRRISILSNQQRLKFKVRRDKRGIVIMNNHFIEELKEKTKDQNYKGKWLKINPPNQEEMKIRKMKIERRKIVLLMNKTRTEKLQQNKIPDSVYNAKMEKYQEILEKIREELPFLESRLAKKQEPKNQKTYKKNKVN